MQVGKSNPVGFKTTLKSTTPSKTGNKHYHLERDLKKSIAAGLGITVKSSDTNKTQLGSVMLAVVKESGVAINFDGTDLTDKAIINTIGQHIRDTLSKGPLSENEMNLTDQMYTLLKTARGHSDSAVFTDASREKRFHYDDTGNPTDALRSGNNKSTTAWSSFFKDCMAFHNILKPSPNTAKMIFESKGESITDNDAKAIFEKIGATKNQINSQLQQGKLLKDVMDLPASTSSDSVFNFLPKIPEEITSFATNFVDSFKPKMGSTDVSTEAPLTNKTGTPLPSIPEEDETEEPQNPVTLSDDVVSVASTTNASTNDAPNLEISTLGVPLLPKEATNLSSIFSSKTFNRINQTLGSMISKYSLNPKDVRTFIVKTYSKASQFSLKSPLEIEATPSGSGAGTSENNAVEADSTGTVNDGTTTSGVNVDQVDPKVIVDGVPEKNVGQEAPESETTASEKDAVTAASTNVKTSAEDAVQAASDSGAETIEMKFNKDIFETTANVSKGCERKKIFSSATKVYNNKIVDNFFSIFSSDPDSDFFTKDRASGDFIPVLAIVTSIVTFLPRVVTFYATLGTAKILQKGVAAGVTAALVDPLMYMFNKSEHETIEQTVKNDEEIANFVKEEATRFLIAKTPKEKLGVIQKWTPGGRDTTTEGKETTVENRKIEDGQLYLNMGKNEELEKITSSLNELSELDALLEANYSDDDLIPQLGKKDSLPRKQLLQDLELVKSGQKTRESIIEDYNKNKSIVLKKMDEHIKKVLGLEDSNSNSVVYET